ncbi:MAG TPA: hypothetical protein VHX14_09455, partial [Thermoanaerobaculia bacterium]|nr:hypothetical protein [Thermoanaerobaculia bacterium]
LSRNGHTAGAAGDGPLARKTRKGAANLVSSLIAHRGRVIVMTKREARFNVDPKTGETIEIDDELSAAIEEAVASSERGESISWEVFRKELFDEN